MDGRPLFSLTFDMDGIGDGWATVLFDSCDFGDERGDPFTNSVNTARTELVMERVPSHPPFHCDSGEFSAFSTAGLVRRDATVVT